MASTFIRTIIIYITLTVSMRLMGKREIGELEVGELVTSLLISEICSIPIDNPDIPLLGAIIPVLFIVSLEIIISGLKNKSSRLKHIIDGEPSYLIYKGRFRQDVLRENRISIEEFLGEMRQAGVGSIDEIEHCIIESNGKISIIREGEEKGLGHLIIADGEINQKNLNALGLNTEKIKKIIGNTPIENIFLLSINDKGERYILLKEEKFIKRHNGNKV